MNLLEISKFLSLASGITTIGLLLAIVFGYLLGLVLGISKSFEQVASLPI